MSVKSSVASNVSESLDSNSCSLEVDVKFLNSSFCHKSNTVSSSFSSCKWSAELNWFSSEYAWCIFSSYFLILINHPSHYLSVSVNVWCRYIYFFSYEWSDCCSESSWDSLKLSFREVFRIDSYSTFSSAVRYSCNWTLECHPCRKSLNFVKSNSWMESYSALVRTTRVVVLRSVTCYCFNWTIIHLNWEWYFYNSLWSF